MTEFADSLELWQEHGFSQNIAIVLNNIASTYFAMDEMESAMETLEEALECHREFLLESFGPRKQSAINSRELKDALCSAASTLANVAYVKMASGCSLSAKFYLQETLRIEQALNNTAQAKEIDSILRTLEPMQRTVNI